MADGRLVPDHKTIADFRRDNDPGIRRSCARFVELCRRIGVLKGACVAIDGSRFRAVNSRDSNFIKGVYVKPDFSHEAEADVYRCPAGEALSYRYTTEEDGLELRRYWTGECGGCLVKTRRTTGKERRITRWAHEHLIEAARARLIGPTEPMTVRRGTVEHPFGTIKAWMGHLLWGLFPTASGPTC